MLTSRYRLTTGGVVSVRAYGNILARGPRGAMRKKKKREVFDEITVERSHLPLQPPHDEGLLKIRRADRRRRCTDTGCATCGGSRRRRFYHCARVFVRCLSCCVCVEVSPSPSLETLFVPPSHPPSQVDRAHTRHIADDRFYNGSSRILYVIKLTVCVCVCVFQE